MVADDNSSRRRLLVAQRAMRGYEELSAAEKIELLLGLADVLPAAEAEAARATAWVVQASEAQQLKFRELLTGEGAK